MIASNLIRLLQGATVAETASFAELVPHLIGEGILTKRCVEGLWSYVISEGVDPMNVRLRLTYYCRKYMLWIC